MLMLCCGNAVLMLNANSTHIHQLVKFIHLVEELLASCSGDKNVRIWAPRRGATESSTSWYCSAVLEDGHTKTVRALSWSPDGRYLATASFDATVAIWRQQGGDWEQVSYSMCSHAHGVYKMTASNGTFLGILNAHTLAGQQQRPEFAGLRQCFSDSSMWVSGGGWG